jgi:hypothetical protein
MAAPGLAARWGVSKSEVEEGPDDGVEDAERNWAIHACAHGCMHLSLDRVTLTLSQPEFQALLELMHRARRRFVGPRTAAALPRPH